MKAVFLRALNDADKASAISSAIAAPHSPQNQRRFELEPLTLSAIPRSPFAYWVSGRFRDLFTTLRPLGESLLVASGTGTLDDFRFLRVWWEFEPDSQGSEPRHWQVYAKGGSYSPYYFDHHLNVNWASDGAEMKAWIVTRYGGGHWARNIRSTEHYFRPGLTWPRRTQGGLSFRAMPAGSIFADKGPAAFVANDDSSALLAFLAVLNSKVFRALVDLQMAFGSYEVGVIQRTPAPHWRPEDQSSLARHARTVWSLKRSIDTATETSRGFTLPALLRVEGDTLTARSTVWSEQVRASEEDVAAIQTELDERCFELYGIDELDRMAITDGFGATGGGSEMAEESPEEEDQDEAEAGADPAALGAELVSWAVGVVFGRFDVRLATGDQPLPSEPEPFDPAPVCSAGMLTGDGGLPLTRPPAGYPLSFTEDGILVDDPGHPRDLATAVRAVFEMVFGPRADAMWQEVAALLDPRDYDLRRWLASYFFEHHLRRHSKSRRRAPILWQFGTPSGRYSVWCYAHRMTRESLFAIQNDIVGPKLATEERRLSSLVTQAGQTPSARERSEIAAQQAFVDEVRAFADEVRRVAPLWNPHLDDGIVLVMAPLWRLVPTHKPWQRELRTKWDELAVGKYDWARSAMHLWPERVLPKCATDRSLAIAHGLEGDFWTERPHGKWAPLNRLTRPIGELVAERTSPAVKAALASLLDASGRAPDVRKRKA